MKFSHTNEWMQSEPDWATIEVKKLPVDAFAAVGADGAGKYPHHFMTEGHYDDKTGEWSNMSCMILHTAQFQEQAKKAATDGDAEAVKHFDSHFEAVCPKRDGNMLPMQTGTLAYQYEADKRTMPAYAFQIPMAVSLGNNGANATSAPVKIVGLSGDVLEIEAWGDKDGNYTACIQDLAGMMVNKSHIPVDYCHDSQQLLGYVNTFDVSTGKLVLSGALTPQRTHKRTEEIIENMANHVPYEASIFFQPSKRSEMEIELLKEGETAMVNGKNVTAPKGGLTVFRKWPLQGIAICPHGADDGTAVYLQSKTDRTITVTVNKRKGEQTMKTHAEVEAEQKAAVEAEAKAKFEQEAKAKQEAEAKAKADAEAKKPEEKKPDEEPEESKMQKTIKQFTAKFGAEKAMEYLGKGMKYADALEAFADEMKAVHEATKQTAKPQIKFQQSVDSGVKGLSPEYQQALDEYAEKWNLSDSQKAEIAAKFEWAKKESHKRGVYVKDANAGVGGGEMKKVGTEQ